MFTRIQTQSQPSNPNSNSAGNAIPKQMRRPKKEPTLFHKKPSRPFGLAAMQTGSTVNGTATSSAGISGTPGTGAGPQTIQARVAGRASPITKPQVQIAAPRPSTPSNAASPSGGSRSATPQASAGAASSSATTAEPTPEVGYQDFRVISTDRFGWKYDVMKFDSRKPVDVNTWARPIKLNRKEMRRAEGNGNEEAPTPVGPMLGPDGKPVIGADGRTVMVDAEGRPIHEAKNASGSGAAKNSKDDKGKKKKFQKKTKQVFLVPDHVRQLRKEERYPWVMEDASGKEVWEGRMEDSNKAELYALLMPTPDSSFRFVPANRWYKFQKRRPQQQQWTLEEAEKMMAKMQKNKDQERWAMRSRNGAAAPTAGGLGGPSLVYDVGGSSVGPGGRRLRRVDNGTRGLFEEDDEEGVQERRRRERERGADGDLDEMEYEEDFADDEEKMEFEDTAADEEAKELEERLKREYHNLNKNQEGYVSEDEEDADNLTGTGKDIKKLVRKIEKNAAYDSDEEKNPYASSEEEQEEETPVPTPTGPAVQDQSTSRPGSTPKSKANSRPASKPSSRPTSRSGSPAPPGSGGSTSSSGSSTKVKSEGSPMIPPPTSPGLGMGGHSVVAKRATSPKPPKMKTPVGGGSRATSPLAGPGGSRVGSPNPVSPGASRATSPAPAAASPSKKRKAEGEVAATPGATGSSANAGGAQPKPKKRKAVPGVAPGTELTAAVLVAWLRDKPGTKTRNCIHYFQPALTDEVKKKRFTELVKEVANLKDGGLVVKSQYRDLVP
ncbi:uncharacterized protein FOMMEDRAFT_142112 [Fomitiporia mediterranea MF3/22]|uniref:uncharacterized protein n=1 Tax=Fomitiporia mediterranea (strain MF3/22) TaxID=694068 RepID=UPI000440867C|nr:uncharacterized protein FOMMEDRAFT_142112 [Fomitiporia mediterranea MF3/22]EJD01511.1 hypothetical protein FOMMEDRAFT_142112 [Fomitiporia mediterranea MF3/22]